MDECLLNILDTVDVNTNLNKIGNKSKRYSLRVLLLKIQAIKSRRKEKSIIQMPKPITSLNVVIPRKLKKSDGYVSSPKNLKSVPYKSATLKRSTCRIEVGSVIRPREEYHNVMVYM